MSSPIVLAAALALASSALALAGCSAASSDAPSDESEAAVGEAVQGTIAYGQTRGVTVQDSRGAVRFVGRKDDSISVTVARRLFDVEVLDPNGKVVARIATDAQGGTAKLRLATEGAHTIVLRGYAGDYSLSLGLLASPDPTNPFDAVCDGPKLGPRDVAALSRAGKGDSRPYGGYKLFRRQRVCAIDPVTQAQDCEPDAENATTSSGDVRLLTNFDARIKPRCDGWSTGLLGHTVLFDLDDHHAACPMGSALTDAATCHWGYGGLCQQPDDPRPASCGTYTVGLPLSSADCGAQYLWADHARQASLGGIITSSCMKLSATDRIETWRGTTKKWTITDVVVVAGTALRPTYDAWPAKR